MSSMGAGVSVSPRAGEAVRASRSFEFFDAAWEVGLEQARERAVGQDLAAGLAARAVVRFIRGVADALDARPTDATGLAVLAVDRHLRAERGHFVWKAATDFAPEARGPLLQRLPHGGVEALEFFRCERLGEADGR